MAYSTIIFDLDDTLYPPTSHIWDLISDRIHTYMIEQVGINPKNVSEVRNHYYKTYGTTLRGLFIHHDVDPRAYLDFVHDFPIVDQLQPDQKLTTMLNALPYEKVIFTNSDFKHANRILNILGIRDQFEKIVGIMDVFPYCKPMKEAFEIAFKKLGMKPGECIFVDDSIRNLDQGNASGLFTVLPNAEQTNQAKPHATIRNLTDLPQVLPCK